MSDDTMDAIRYRWIRDRAAKLAIYSDVPVDVMINAEWQDKPGQLDATIDAEIAAGVRYTLTPLGAVMLESSK